LNGNKLKIRAGVQLAFYFHLSVFCLQELLIYNIISPHFISNSLEAFMFEIDSIELLGYVATFFVAASFLFKSIVSLRTVNCIGAILFVIYGLLKGSYPVALLNIFLVLVNVYQLWRLRNKSTVVSVK